MYVCIDDFVWFATDTEIVIEMDTTTEDEMITARMTGTNVTIDTRTGETADTRGQT